METVNKTKVIRIFETFAGIGAQHKAITNIKANMEIVQTSEWDVRAILAYAQIHNPIKFKEELTKANKLNIEEINKYLFDFTFSLNSKTPGHVLRKKDDFKRNVYAANMANNNLPDITKVTGDSLEGIDLLTYSFPCQGLSIANMGRDKGIKETSDSTSNLIWQIRRILLEANQNKIKLPKYLLMENVKNLLSKKHIGDYEKWLKFLEGLGYSTGTTIVNGFNHGSLQKRERVFALSILDGGMTDDNFKTLLMDNKNKLNVGARKKKYLSIFDKSTEEEIIMSIPNNTPSRVKMATENHNLLERKWRTNHEYTFNTLTTKQDRHPNLGMIKHNMKLEGKLDHRFITPREGYMIMGFDSSDYTRVHKKYKEGYITKEALYRQSGNSIVVPVLESIFKIIEELEGERNV